MPNRVLRDWTDSKAIQKLTWQEEVLFTRLIMKVDDYGNFDADPLIVKSLCFPRKDGLRVSDIESWLNKLKAASLIRFYQSNGDTFLHIRNFRQRLDRAKRKYPTEPTDTNESLSITTDPQAETKRNESETKKRAHTPFVAPALDDVVAYFVSNGYSKEAAQKAFKYYDEAEPPWSDSRGNKVRSWKSKMNAVWFKPENEVKKQNPQVKEGLIR